MYILKKNKRKCDQSGESVRPIRPSEKVKGANIQTLLSVKLYLRTFAVSLLFRYSFLQGVAGK